MWIIYGVSRPMSPYPCNYQRHNPEHQDWLMWWLEQWQIPPSHWDWFGNLLSGRSIAETIVKETKDGEIRFQVSYTEILLKHYRRWGPVGMPEPQRRHHEDEQ